MHVDKSKATYCLGLAELQLQFEVVSVCLNCNRKKGQSLKKNKRQLSLLPSVPEGHVPVLITLSN